MSELRLSVSQLNSFARCPRAWAYNKICGYKEPPKWALQGGSAMDATLNMYWTEVLKSRPAPVDVLQDFYKTSLRQIAEEEGLPSDPKEGVDTLDEGTRLIPVYLEKHAPHVRPVEVQKEVKPVIAGIPFLGYIDLIRETNSGKIIADHKFTGSRPNERVAAGSNQLRVYSVATGETHVEIVSLVRRKRDPDVVVTPHFVTPDDVADLEAATRYTAWHIEQKRYPLTAANNFQVCAPDKCGFWHRCRGRVGGPEPIPGEVR